MRSRALSVLYVGLMEPMYVCDIITPQSAVSGVYSTLWQRRGTVEGAYSLSFREFCCVLCSYFDASLFRCSFVSYIQCVASLVSLGGVRNFSRA